MSLPSMHLPQHSLSHSILGRHDSRPRSMTSAITFPRLLFRPRVSVWNFPLPPEPATLSLHSQSQSFLSRLPLEILVLILHQATVTSRVNLALTSKTFAKLLGDIPEILSFDLRFLSPQFVELLKQDESLQCWSISTSLLEASRYSLRSRYPHPPQFRHIDNYTYSLKCKYCITVRDFPRIEIPRRGPRNQEVLSALWTNWERHCQYFDRAICEHTRQYACRGGGGRIFTQGMKEVLDVYIKEKIKERNLQYVRAGVVYWAMAQTEQTL